MWADGRSQSLSLLFPPPPRGLKGRTAELATLTRTIEHTAPARLALVGAGGSGKSMLACALGHRLSRRFEGRIHWVRVGAWDFRTLVEILALRFGTSRVRSAMVREVRAFLSDGGERLVVLDNHEDDHAMARLLDELASTPTTFVITARRCLLAGVFIFPVTAPRVTSGLSAFPRVAALTRVLRWNPLALDIADALVATEAATVAELAAYLDAKGASRVKVIAHEDDLPEVALLVDWAWARLDRAGRRILGVLAHAFGDHMDVAAITRIARVREGTEGTERSLAVLAQWHLVQEPMHGRYALHAVVRHALVGRTPSWPDRVFDYYVSLLERHPESQLLEQTNLFAAMDHAQRAGNLSAMLRIDQLLAQL